MTTFGDQVYQNGGMPVGASGVPTTYGNYIFVNPDSSTFGNGSSMKKPYKFIGQAITKAVSGNHDVILLHGNSGLKTGNGAADEEIEATLTKGRVHFVGLGGGSRYQGQRSRWTMGVTTTEDSDAIAVLQNTGVGNTFTNIKFDSSDTNTSSLYVVAEGGEYAQYTNCEFFKSTLLGTANTATVLMNGDTAYMKNCAIGSSATQHTSTTHSNVLFTRETITGKVARDTYFDNCVFLLNSSQTAAANWRIPGATDIERMCWAQDCLFHNVKLSAAVVEAIEMGAEQTQGFVVLKDCYQVNHTNFCSGTTDSVHFAGPERATAGTAGDSIALT